MSQRIVVRPLRAEVATAVPVRVEKEIWAASFTPAVQAEMSERIGAGCRDISAVDQIVAHVEQTGRRNQPLVAFAGITPSK